MDLSEFLPLPLQVQHIVLQCDSPKLEHFLAPHGRLHASSPLEGSRGKGIFPQLDLHYSKYT